MNAISTAEALYKIYDQGGERQPVLRGIDLTIERGEFLCIMGPSGSGKSTLLHLLSGLDTPSGGTVLLEGEDLAKLSERRRTLKRRAAIGYVFQFFNLMGNLSVRENLGLPLAIAGSQPDSAKAQIEALAERLGLTARLDAFPHQLSGGEMQRTSIARALIGGQPLLLCDEPTGNLAQQAGAEVMELLRQCVDRDGRSVLLVTHNPRDACFADQVRFLVDGQLAESPVLRGPKIPVERVHETLAGLSI